MSTSKTKVTSTSSSKNSNSKSNHSKINHPQVTSTSSSKNSNSKCKLTNIYPLKLKVQFAHSIPSGNFDLFVSEFQQKVDNHEQNFREEVNQKVDKELVRRGDRIAEKELKLEELIEAEVQRREENLEAEFRLREENANAFYSKKEIYANANTFYSKY